METNQAPTPNSVWVVQAEYTHYHLDVIAVAQSLEQVIEWMPEIIKEGWDTDKDFVGYYVNEEDVGVLDQDDYTFCRFDKNGKMIEGSFHKREDR